MTASRRAFGNALSLKRRPLLPLRPNARKTIKVKHEVLMWPEGTQDALTDLVQCDKCQSWYHVGCLGIREDDPRLEEGAEFVCPVCTDPKHHSRAIDVRGSSCARPGCKIFVFVISHIIGSRHIAEGGGRRDEWLVKWYGYSTAEASWEQTSASLDHHIEDFKEQARQEGRDPDENPNDDILLKEALDAGFRHL
ncbi:hypothetical protein CPB85DRAFT_281839 [Mucidula mucida]|nr:hypothetical protein CPB85DRAFT_281839 [Mucidula mucida]